MKIAIHQPNYLPWCGFFTKMINCDVFVILDDAAIPNGRSFVSRTKIRNRDNEQWLSVPVSKSGTPPIKDVSISEPSFCDKHLKTLHQNYAKADFYSEMIEIIEPALRARHSNLCALNIQLLRSISKSLGIGSELVLSSDLNVEEKGDERLIQLVKKLGGKCYLSGPGGENYQNKEKFEAAGITLEVKTYRPIPYQTQTFPFVPGLSIIDALAVAGSSATRQVLRYL
ncbi:MAG TPA: WbqC family protein [Microvirga sp.]|nr:WbqC family protein [Microvirga sp.]